jgi:hypothetical protein
MDVDRHDAARKSKGTVPRKQAEHPDDRGIDLAPPVTPAQRRELAALRYRGPWPSTGPQAEAILQQWRRSAPSTEPAAPPG